MPPEKKLVAVEQSYIDTAVQVPGKWTRHRLMYCVRLRRWARHPAPAKYQCAAMTQQPAGTYTLRGFKNCPPQRGTLETSFPLQPTKPYAPPLQPFAYNFQTAQNRYRPENNTITIPSLRR